MLWHACTSYHQLLKHWDFCVNWVCTRCHTLLGTRALLLNQKELPWLSASKKSHKGLAHCLKTRVLIWKDPRGWRLVGFVRQMTSCRHIPQSSGDFTVLEASPQTRWPKPHAFRFYTCSFASVHVCVHVCYLFDLSWCWALTLIVHWVSHSYHSPCRQT